MTNLPELLAQLAEWPEVCRLGKFKRYEIGNYRFGFADKDNLYAICGNNIISGQPAHAWLQGALQQVCEGKGWGYSVGRHGGSVAELLTGKQRIYRYCEYPLLECIIAALQLQDK